MKKTLFITTSILVLTSCTSDKNFKSKLEQTLEENPEIITNTIKKNPEKFMTALRDMAMEARKNAAAKQEQNLENEINEYIQKPLPYSLRKDELVRGTKDGKITIVEYSDFQCPFCARGMQTIKEILKKYEGQVSFVYKHLPIDNIHPQARLASQYYEAIRIVGKEKAFAFHDRILTEQNKIRHGASYFDKVTKELGLDLKKVKKLVSSKEVNDRIKEDEKEAAKNGFSGTPGFLVEGVPVRGAYPIQHFDKIIQKLKVAKKI
ncbi:thioredoxin domain-containing protein [Bacteriovorax sp. DB6_IX]|uniref:DsbA family protein n=1 Tax=Bacteriovorax sp. DB6_IX TaxID=1353530 RepID=UPI00038A0B1D|nr:thioredoxin domain-containing protein [Bacteriovorax sp. DB6_IX]EQC51992.1 DSBA-like thioredoxin domain protein [Bacteriovorax sp. DB6_IX]